MRATSEHTLRGQAELAASAATARVAALEAEAASLRTANHELFRAKSFAEEQRDSAAGWVSEGGWGTAFGCCSSLAGGGIGKLPTAPMQACLVECLLFANLLQGPSSLVPQHGDGAGGAAGAAGAGAGRRSWAPGGAGQHAGRPGRQPAAGGLSHGTLGLID